jgi:hypothetical protein
MARGFESKDVEFQQAEAARARLERTGRRELSAVDRDRERRRQSIELSLLQTRRELARAVRAAHREMLERAVLDLERELTALETAVSRPIPTSE